MDPRCDNDDPNDQSLSLYVLCLQCLTDGQGVLLLLAPDWSVLTLPGAWLEAAAQVPPNHQQSYNHQQQKHQHQHQHQPHHDLILRWSFPSSLALEPSPHSPATISRRPKDKDCQKRNYYLLARYEHNLVRDTAIMAVAHLVWLLLALLLTFALLGLAQNAEVLQLPVEVFHQYI